MAGVLTVSWGRCYQAFILNADTRDRPIMHAGGLAAGWRWDRTACNRRLYEWPDGDDGRSLPLYAARLPVGWAQQIARPCLLCVRAVGCGPELWRPDDRR